MSDVTLYLLWYDNGLGWEDNEHELLGVYASAEDRAAAIEHYESISEQWPFRKGGEFQNQDVRLGEHLVK